MGELYEPYPRLPKNFRQIGERDDIVRVYLEDYVNTYLKRLFPVGGQDLRAGLLLGNTEEHGGLAYVFIDGALEMENVTETGEKVEFTEEAWQKAYQSMEEMFPKRTVQGWFLCGAPGSQLSPLNYWKQHGQYFSGKNKLMYLNSGLEGEEALYITSSDGFYKLRGHCIYYERNQMMQDYMVLRKDSKRVETGGSDPVIRDFRRKMEQKKEMAQDQSHTIHFLRGMCGCLAVLTLAGGVAALNSVEKMKDMEAVMASVLPDADGVAGMLLGGADGSGNGMGIIVEEASGDVFPTVADPNMADVDTAAPGAAGLTVESGQEAAEAASGLVEARGAGADGGAAAAEDTLPAARENQLESGESGSRESSLGGSQSGSSQSGNSQSGSGQSGSGQSGSGQSGSGQSGSSQSGNRQSGSGQSGSGQSGSGQSGSSQSGSSTSGAAASGDGDEASEAFAGQASGRQLEPKPGQSVYMVQEGDTLYGICFKLYQNLSQVDEICRINGLDDVNHLEAGRRLIVP